jgi:phosphoglycerol transferase
VDWKLSVLLGVVYNFLPYHLMRGTGHVLLAAYWAVPLGMSLAMTLALGEPVFFQERGALRLRPVRPSREVLFAVFVIAMSGMTGSGYYEFFTAALLGFAGVLGALRRRALAPLLSGAVSAVAVGLCMVLSMLPNLLFFREHGRAVANPRYPQEAEFYALKIGQLFIPESWNRFPVLAEIGATYNKSLVLINENTTSSFGIVTSIALLFLLGAFFAPAAAKLRSAPTTTAARAPGRASVTQVSDVSDESGDVDENGDTARIFAASRLGLLAIFIGTVGGLGALVAVYLDATIRCYNRISVYVAFFSLLTLALVVQKYVVSRLRTDKAHVRLVAALLCVGTVAIYDQTATSDDTPYPSSRAAFQARARFIGRIEERMPEGAMIYQLPYVPFPDETGYADVFGYSYFDGYVHSKTLKWSYGTLIGRRHDDWHRGIMKKSTPDLLAALAHAGFSGVYLGTATFPESEKSRLAEVRALLGEPTVTNEAGDLFFFDLRNFTMALRAKTSDAEWETARTQTLYPPYVSPREGFYPEERDPRMNRSFRWAQGDAVLFVENASAQPVPARLSMIVGGATVSTLTLDGVLADSVEVRPPQPYVHDVVIPPGEHQVHVRSTSPNLAGPGEKRDLRFFIERLELTPLPATEPAREPPAR